jgi:anti-anti-sigma regulatory factor
MNALRRSCSPVQVTVSQPDAVTVRVRLAGDLDVTGESLLVDLAAAVVAAAPASVEVDAGDLVFVDLRGLRALGDLCARVGAAASVRVVRTSRALDRLVAVCASSGALSGLPAPLTRSSSSSAAVTGSAASVAVRDGASPIPAGAAAAPVGAVLRPTVRCRSHVR